MSILIPKYKDLLWATMDKPIPVRYAMKGEFRCILYDANGRLLRDTGWFDNLVTDFMFTTGGFTTYWSDRFHIGSSNQAPSVSDTTLVAWLAQSNTSVPSGNSAGVEPTAPNYERWNIKGRRFLAGVGTGTVRELGLSYQSSNTNMCVRTLVTPEIPKAADQVLDVFHKMTFWPDLSTTTGQVTIDGTLYDWSCRYGNALKLGDCHNPILWSPVNGTGYVSAGSADLSDVEVRISGTTRPSSTNTTIQYAANGIHDKQTYWGLDNGNTGSGIRSAEHRLANGVDVANDPVSKIEFAAAVGGATIPKDSTKTFYIDWRLQCVRH